jgi:acetyl-CoA carboxylase biotin carboxylase subunit
MPDRRTDRRESVFDKVLIANRGAVAARVLRALNSLGVRSVAVYSDADRDAPWVRQAGEAIHIGGAPAVESYLNQDVLLDVLRRTGADGLHPGYGFLAENYVFAQKVEDQGSRFIGPSPRWVEAMGHKTRARELAARNGLPVGRGSEVVGTDREQLLAAAAAVGYPILVKPASGGGGIGMLPVRAPDALHDAVQRASALGLRGFGNGEVYLEHLIERPRHVEVQVMGDRHGAVRHLFERDCSVQRRHQKIIEEAPAPGIARDNAEALGDRVAAMLRRIGYDNIGTVEMLMDAAGEFAFLEMNTRLQVEHGVTEAITGVDLVIAQIRAAAGDPLSVILPEEIVVNGHAIEARVYAEDPQRFFPSPGPLTVFRPPSDPAVRVETGYAQGLDVTPYYDPLLAKVIVHGPSRDTAIDRLREALSDFAIEGVRHNILALQRILGSEAFRAGDVHTGLVDELQGRNFK